MAVNKKAYEYKKHFVWLLYTMFYLVSSPPFPSFPKAIINNKIAGYGCDVIENEQNIFAKKFDEITDLIPIGHFSSPSYAFWFKSDLRTASRRESTELSYNVSPI